MAEPLGREAIERGMRRQHETLARALAAGDRCAGWKLGLGAPALRQRFGLERAAVGYLLASREEKSGALCSLAGGTRICVEPEVAIHLGAAVPPDASAAAAAAAIAGLGPALEIVDLDRPLEDLEELLASNIFQRGACFGPCQPEARLEGVRAEIRFHGEERTVDAAAAVGDVVAAVRGTALELARVGARLEAGDRILSGALVPPIRVGPGDTIELLLGPLGSVALRFGE